jgi:hypothetical protein
MLDFMLQELDLIRFFLFTLYLCLLLTQFVDAWLGFGHFLDKNPVRSLHICNFCLSLWEGCYSFTQLHVKLIFYQIAFLLYFFIKLVDLVTNFSHLGGFNSEKFIFLTAALL